MNENNQVSHNGLVVKLPNHRSLFMASFACFLCAEPIQYILNIFGVNGTAQLALTLAIVYLPLVAGLLCRRTIKWGFLALIVLVAAIVAFTLLIYPEYKDVLVGDKYYYSFKNQVLAPFGSIFGFLFVEYIDDFKDIKKVFIISAIILFAFYSVQAAQSGGVWVVGNTGRIAYYSMSFSYGILFPILIFFTYGFENKRIIPIIVGIAGVFEIIVYGSRGALVVLMLYFILYMLWAWVPKRRQIKWVFVSLASIMLVFFFVSANLQEELINTLINRTSSLGYNSRLLSVLSSRSLFSEDRITSIWPATLQLIKNSFLLGNGLYSNHFYNGGFAHNIILELIADFGLLFGGGMLLFCGKTINDVIKKSNYKEERFIFVIIISFCIGRLMFSSSFWYEKLFWIYLACYFKINKYNPRLEMQNDI